MRGMTYLFLGMSRRGLVLVYYFLLWYRLSSDYGAVLLIVNTFIATGHIWFARTESEHACCATTKRSFPARLLILKGNALHLFENKCVIVCFQCTIHSAQRLLLLTKVCLSSVEDCLVQAHKPLQRTVRGLIFVNYFLLFSSNYDNK